jgi:predicted nuclease of predicted toxin-antitoxin system
MRILFDHNVPVPLRQFLEDFAIKTAYEHGWDRITNGHLVDAADANDFDVLLTADKGFLYQQNLSHRRIAVVILSRGNWPDVKKSTQMIIDALRTAKRGTCTLVDCG